MMWHDAGAICPALTMTGATPASKAGTGAGASTGTGTGAGTGAHDDRCRPSVDRPRNRHCIAGKDALAPIGGSYTARDHAGAAVQCHVSWYRYSAVWFVSCTDLAPAPMA